MRLRTAIVATIASLCVASITVTAAHAQLIYDAITNADNGFRPQDDRLFMGDLINFDTGGSGPVTVNRLEALLVHGPTTVTYTSLVMNVQFWNDNNGVGNDLFSNPASDVLTFDILPALSGGGTSLTLGVNEILSVNVSLPGVVFTDPFLNGITINFQGDFGSGLQSTANLSTLVRYGVNGPAVGSSGFTSPTGGYLKDTTGRNDFNFNRTGDSFNVPGQNNSGLAIRLYASTVPEPGTMTLVGVGLLALGGTVVRRRRRSE
jgi:PEP-CTERM putative exosortase interaction domain